MVSYITARYLVGRHHSPIIQTCVVVSSLAPESGLLGENANEAALVDQWVHFGESEISHFSYEILALVSGYLGPYSKEVCSPVIPTRGTFTRVAIIAAQCWASKTGSCAQVP
jgi:hypothetical protein